MSIKMYCNVVSLISANSSFYWAMLPSNNSSTSKRYKTNCEEEDLHLKINQKKDKKIRRVEQVLFKLLNQFIASHIYYQILILCIFRSIFLAAIEEELGVAAAEETEVEYLQETAEREIVTKNLLGTFGSVVALVAANAGNHFNVCTVLSKDSRKQKE